jgi:flagellar basal body-associated protein FliL
MLKPNGMSDAAAEKKDDKAAAAGGGNKKVLIIIVAVNVALAGAVGGFMFMSGKDKSAERAKGGHAKKAAGEHEGGDEEGEGEEGGEDDGESHAKSQFGPLLEVGSFVANLQSPPGQPPRYIKVNVSVEAQNEEAKMRVESALIPIKTEALMMLSNAKVEDVVGQEKIIALSEQLAKRANKLIGKKSIKRVYFSELVVQ